MDTKVLKLINEAEAVVIGAGAGLSAAAGIVYSGERFESKFAAYIDRYGMKDMYSAGFYPFETQEEKWGYWSQHIYENRYAVGKTALYERLLEIVKDKEHFVLTTNVDHQFALAGFEEDRIFATQGDYGLFQCSKPCHTTLYHNEAIVKKMIENQKDCRVSSNLVPKCPKCGENLTMHLRADDTFVQNEDWDIAHSRYQKFIQENQSKKIVFLELGVGMNTPSIIKYPFWKLTYELDDAFYICLNKGDASVPREIKKNAYCLERDIAEVLM